MPAGRKLKNGLTAVQEKYCRERAKGKTQEQAYRASHPDSRASNKSQAEIACRTERKEIIQKRLAELQDMVDAGLLPTLEQIQMDLMKIAEDESKPEGVRLKAYDQLTRMRGGYRDRVEVDAGVSMDGFKSALSDLLQ